MSAPNLPSLDADGGLNRYLQEIRKFPLLEADEEYMLAQRYRAHDDPKAAHALVTSHLRLVAKVAFGYRGYGLPIGEVVSEGNVGLMQAVKKFDPDKGFRLATYAVWWIRAAIQDYILRSWSLVKLGTTAAQKKLFFGLRRAKGQIAALEEGDLTPTHVAQLATKFGVGEKDVIDMNRRLSGDLSLNAPIGDDDGQWQDWLVDDSDNAEVLLTKTDESSQRHELLGRALAALNEREKIIFMKRRLQDDPATLEELAAQFSISRERVRQVEGRAFEKVQAHMQNAIAQAQTKALPAR